MLPTCSLLKWCHMCALSIQHHQEHYLRTVCNKVAFHPLIFVKPDEYVPTLESHVSYYCIM